MTDTVKAVGSSNKNNNKNLVEIFVRNCQKKAIRLWLQKKLNMANFRQIIYERMKIKTEDQALFLQGKLIEYDENELDLHNGYIFHIVNLSRVKISTISIHVKRIQPNSTVYKFTLQPQMLVGQFIKEVLSTKFHQITNYFMVYTGRELQNDKTFLDEYIQDGSQILLIHKVQNRKSQTIENKKRTKPSKVKKQQLQKVENSKAAKNNLNDSFNQIQFSREAIKDEEYKKIESENENEKQNNEKYQLVNNSFKYQISGSQLAKQQEIINKKSQELNAKELYQTGKFNKIEAMNQQGSQNEQQTEILINNYNAFTYNINSSNLNQKAISPIKNATNHNPNQQIITRYGLVPQKQLTRIDRSSGQQEAYHIVLSDSIQLVNEKSSMELKSKNDQVQSKHQEKQSEFLSDPYLRISNGSYEKTNSFLLKTISSKYDDQGISLENSQRKKEEDNQLSYEQSQAYSGGIKSSLKYRIGYHMMQNTQNVSSHKSFKQSTSQNLQAKGQNGKQQVEKNNKKIQQLDKKHLHAREIIKNETEPKKSEQKLDESFQMGGEKKNDKKFVKKQNMIEVKDLTKTVDADFYMPPNLQTSSIVMSKQKLTYKSQLKGNAKQSQTPSPSRNIDDLSSQIGNSEQDKMLQNVAFVNNPMGHIEVKNQILEGASKTYSIQEGDDEMIKQIRVTKISQHNDILSQNSSAVSRYIPQSQSSDNPFKKMIEMANRHVRLQLSPEQKQELANRNNQAKYHNIYNMSYVSSGYQVSVVDSNQPINEFAFHPNPVYLHNLSNFSGTGRQSFISDAPQQMYDRSQKFSGTSIQSEIITSTQYPMMHPPEMGFTQNKQYRFNSEALEKEDELKLFQKQLQEDMKMQTLEIEQDKMSLSMKKKEKISETDIKNNVQEENTQKHQYNSQNLQQNPRQSEDIAINAIYPVDIEGKSQENIKVKEKAIKQDSLLLEGSTKNIQSSEHIFQKPQMNKENELLNYLDVNTNKIHEQNGVSDYIHENYQQQLYHERVDNNSFQYERTVKKPENPAYLSFSFSYEKQAINPERTTPICLNVGDMIMTGIGLRTQIKSYAQSIRQQIYRQFQVPQESVNERKKYKQEQKYEFNEKELKNRNKIQEYLEQYTKNRQPLEYVLKNENLVQKQQSNLMQDQQLYEYENQQKQNGRQEFEQNLLNDYL